ncbi:MAG TPA: N-acetyl-alpha-D-glucosaminyl L-malate synthase BshA [Planctomycetota bacterium]|nr:N-acetyl-alpha-D-glucosaminyl L-malate synthase BshA [Planctomycetota bacterium]HPF12953.1 N-acetyl-alpha-D-glucosaminyl L-malate synthase BshA [Planctomycetota bacterium]HRV82672.1 N-acetyl-alpha-D-glucosaminyl L-malate synthase BshA [Planctomycetota bacterium]
MTGPIKIGILCHPTYGGSGVVASELALSLADRGNVVHLFSHEVPPRLARSGGPVEMHVAQGLPYPLFATPPHDLAITSRILDVHRKVGLDILHAHYAIPHAVSAYLAREASRAYKTFPPPKLVTTLHGTDITLVGNDPSYAALTEHILLASDRVTTVSHDLAVRTCENFKVLATPCEIEVIPNFVDLEFFKPHEGLWCNGPVAVHVSNFRPVKQVPWLVRCFARAVGDRQATLLLVGDGPDQPAARQVAEELGVASRVRFLGTRDALPQLLGPADVYCSASIEESFGLSALEAMACGTPVVSTRVGGVPEVVDDGVTGFLTEPGNLEAYADALAKLLFDRPLSKQMGQAAREQAMERFDRHKITALYEAMYLRLLGRS